MAEDADYASPDDLLTLQSDVAETDATVTVNGKPFTVHLRAFEFVEDLIDTLQTTEALQKRPMPVPLPAGDRSGHKTFKPTKTEISIAVKFSRMVTQPKMDANQWLIFTHRNSFAASDLSIQCDKISGITYEEVEEGDGAKKDELSGVTEAKAALSAAPFPAPASSDLPGNPALPSEASASKVPAQ